MGGYFSKLPEEILHVNPEGSRLVTFGINCHTSDRFQRRANPITADNAELVRDSFVEVGAVSENNAYFYKASKHKHQCSFEGMKAVVKQYARDVKKNGLFLFYLSGHGIRTRENNDYVLAPADFDYTYATALTAQALYSWFSEINCAAKYIVIILEACYSGGIQKELIETRRQSKDSRTIFSQRHNWYVISACEHDETISIIEPLGNSVFTYFFSNILRSYNSSNKLPLRDIFEECKACSLSLAHTFQGFDRGQCCRILGTPVYDSVADANSGVLQKDYKSKYYNKDLNIEGLSNSSLDFLRSLIRDEGSPLRQLEERGMLSKDRVFQTVICTMMHSVASKEMVDELSKEPSCSFEKVSNPNLLITAFTEVIATIDEVHTVSEVSAYIFHKCSTFYRQPLMNELYPNYPKLNPNAPKHKDLDELIKRLKTEADESAESAEA